MELNGRKQEGKFIRIIALSNMHGAQMVDTFIDYAFSTIVIGMDLEGCILSIKGTQESAAKHRRIEPMRFISVSNGTNELESTALEENDMASI